MKFEYLLFNILVVIAPLIFSFERQIRFVREWRFAIPAIVIVAIPFVLWDAKVAGKHWYFNALYTFDARILGLPVEEILFFLTVPFASLFSWRVLNFYVRGKISMRFDAVRASIFALFLPGVYAFAAQKEYTGLALCAFALSGFLDRQLQTHLYLKSQTYIFLGIVCIFNLICNSYLTARPVIMYNDAYNLGLRVWTIPVEDFFYGAGLIMLGIIVFERLSRIEIK